MTCTCCGGPLEMETEVLRGKCVSCSLGLCRCRSTPAEVAAADRAVDAMADAAGLGDVDEHDPDCRCGRCEDLARDREADRADVVAKEGRR